MSKPAQMAVMDPRLRGDDSGEWGECLGGRSQETRDMVERVLVGAIAGAHGVRGAVRIRSFTDDPAAVAAYGPVFDEAGARQLVLKVTGPTKGGVIAEIDGVADRDAAESLRGVRLYVPRAALPSTDEDEFYQADLIGLAVETVDGDSLGRVRAVQNFGAGDLLEVERADGSTVSLPFSRAAVPVVDIGAGRIVADPPAGLLDPPERRAGAAE
jgi:16S rRNA processing protein RimM